MNIDFDSDEEFGNVGEFPFLNREQDVERDVEGFKIKGLYNSQFRDINSILRENKDVFIYPLRQAELVSIVWIRNRWW